MILDIDIIKLRSYLITVAYKYYQDSDNIDDLVQNTLVKIYSNLDKFDGTNIKAWAVTILKNLYINQYRELNRRDTILVEDFYQSYEDYSSESFKPTQGESYDIQLLTEYIDHLEPLYNSVLRLRLKGYKYFEIADILELPLGTVKSALFTARLKIKSYLSHVEI